MLTKKESYVWIILFLLLFSYLIEFLFFEFPAGWDLSPHYYIYSKAIQSLKNGMILTYDNNWYGGYPLFSLYPPGSYYFLGLLHFLSFGLISQELSFKLSYFLIPFLFIICIFYLTKSFFGKKSAYFSLFLTYLFLFSDIRYAHLNIGLGGQFYVGLLTSTISTIFMLVFFLQIRLYELYQKKINAFFCSLCLSIVIISNVITAIFTFWILTFFFIFKKKMRIFLIVIIVISFFITSYWWVNFLIHFQFSATNTIGLREDIISDPLLAIFQDIDTIKMLFLNYKDIININNDLIGQISLSRLLIDFPYLGILTLIGTFFSIVRLIKNKHFLLPTVFLISIIFLPRNFFNAIIDIPIHYYRFIYFISIISIILSAYGLRIFYHRMKVTRHKIIFSTTKITLAAFIIIGIIAKTISGVDWNREIVIDNISINPNYKFSAERYDTYHKTKKILNFFQEQNPQGRIAIEGSVYSMFYLGSPHLLSSIIPLKLDLEVFPGLLAESAQSSAFINPLLTIGSNHISWGRNNLLSNFDFLSSSHKEIIDRFRRFGTEYIIATSNTYIKNLDKAIGKELEVVLDLQDIKVYQLKTYIKKTLTSDYKPFFFIEDGGVSFFDFYFIKKKNSRYSYNRYQKNGRFYS